MSDVVNLNRVRKAKRRAAGADQVAANRVAFGRTAAEKATARAEAERQARLLDANRRED